MMLTLFKLLLVGCCLSTTLAQTLPPSQEFLLVAEKHQIRGVDLQTGDLDVIPPIVAPPGRTQIVYGVDYVAETGEVVWCDASFDAIFVGSASGRRAIASGLNLPIDVAVDWISKNVYFTDTILGIVGVASLHGHFYRVLINTGLDKPRAIAVDPVAGYVFWTDRGTTPKIERADMDGKNRRVIFRPFGWPIGLVLDRTIKRVYWMDALTNSLEYCNYDGTGYGRVFYGTGSYDIHPFAVAMNGSHFMWSDWTGKGIFSLLKVRPPPPTSYMFHRLTTFDEIPFGIEFYDPNRRGGTNACSTNNGDCEQLCLPRPYNVRTCFCTRGHLQSDGTSCSIQADTSSPYFLVADYDDARALDVRTLRDVHPPLAGLKLAIAIDFDPVTDDIYYTDILTDRLHKMTSDGVIDDSFVPPLALPVGVAVDWIGRQVYYTDVVFNMVAIGKMDGSAAVAVVRDNMTNPRDIALDLKRGKMYWTDHFNSTGRIERANMDGSGREVIVTGLKQPNGITLDLENEHVYWADSNLTNIGRCDFDGSNCLTLTSSLNRPYDLVVHDDFVYYTDWNEKKILRVPVNQPQGVSTSYANPSTPLTLPSGIIVYDKEPRLKISNNCSTNNGDCLLFCTPTGIDSRRCVCPINKKEFCLPEVKLIIAHQNDSGLMLECEICRPGVALTYSRIYKNRVFVAYQFYGRIAESCEIHRFWVQAGPSNQGEYRCTATNVVGIGASSAVLVGSRPGSLNMGGDFPDGLDENGDTEGIPVK